MGANLDQLRYFCEIVRTKGFTRAAKTLRITQPALSKAVRQLEEIYSVELLLRNSGEVIPSAEGTLFYERAVEILECVDKVDIEMKNIQGKVFGNLRVGSSDNFANHVLPEIFNSFLNLCPEVKLDLFTGTAQAIQDELLDRRIELGLFFNRTTDKNLVLTPLTEVEFVVVCKRDNLKKSSLKGQTELLRSMSFVGSRLVDYKEPYLALQMLRSAKIEPRNLIAVNNQETQKNLALSGVGYTLIPRFMVKQELESGAAAQIRFPKPFLAPAYLAVRAGIRLSTAASRFRAYLESRVPDRI